MIGEGGLKLPPFFPLFHREANQKDTNKQTFSAAACISAAATPAAPLSERVIPVAAMHGKERRKSLPPGASPKKKRATGKSLNKKDRKNELMSSGRRLIAFFRFENFNHFRIDFPLFPSKMRFPKPQFPALSSRQSAFAAGAVVAATTAAVTMVSARGRAERNERLDERFRATVARRAAASAASGRAFAQSLADPSRSTLLAFYAPDCRLCAEVVDPLIDVATEERDWLDIIPIDADDGAAWALEALRYKIVSVPSYVMLDSQGKARGKSLGWPEDLEAASRAVERLVGAARPKKRRQQQQQQEQASTKK